MSTEREHGSGKGPFVAGMIAGGIGVIAIRAALMRKRTTRTGMRMEAWALRAKSEILRNMADMEDMTDREFKTVVDAVTSKYGEMGRVNKEKVRDLAREFKSRWKELKEDAEEAAEEE